MEATSSLGVVIAFTAGLLSFLSPCVLPLIPSYVTFITGLSLDDVSTARRSALLHSLLFIAGFTLIFLALGATATVLGRLLLANRMLISRLGGVLIIVFGLYLLGVFNFAWMSTERRVHLADKPMGYLGSVLVGVAFGAGWTPCIGPILGSILLLASNADDVRRGVLLLFVYSLGLAVPFLLSSLAIRHFMSFFQRIRRQLVWISRGSGALLVAVGVLLVTNYFTILASYLQAWTPEFLKSRL